MRESVPVCLLAIALGLGGLSAASAAPLAQLHTPADWKAWRAEGDWKWNGEWIGGEGTGSWRYAEVGGPEWKDYQVDFQLRLGTPSDRREPKWEGGWYFAAYRNNENIAGYEAGLAFRKQGREMYRLMFSLPWQEVMLWSSRGGFLAVVPCALETGRTYEVRVLVQGPRVKVALDRRTLFEHWDRTGMLASGGVALGLHEGAAAFSQVEITAAPPLAGPVPPQVPDLHFRDWKGARWAWDGTEPICRAGNDAYGHEVKLVPGYRPQVQTWWFWLNYGEEAFNANKLQDFQVWEEGNRLRFVVICTDNQDKTWLTSRAEVTITYDPAKNTYVHDVVSTLVIPEGHSLRLNHPIEFTDPLVHGHVGSASPNDSWETPHPWSVYKHVSGKLYKHPHNHVTWYPGFGEPAWREAKGNYLDPQGGFWAVVGDPIANPVWSLQGSSVPGSEFYTELCGWAFDVHMRWYPVKSGETLAPGTYTVNWRLTSVDGKQADEWLAQADFCAPGDLNKELLLYTAGIGNVERFGKVVKWASPFYEYPWGDASLLDKTVGHGDNTSLRLDGPQEAGAAVGGSVFSDPVLPDTSYEVSAWVKTKDVQGEGPGLMFGGQFYFPLITGTTDWQKIGFVCRPNEPLHTVPFRVLNSGSGSVWFDDFMIRPLKEGETPVAPIAAAPQPIAAPDALPDQTVLWNTQSEAKDVGRTLLDLSKHGNHARLMAPAAVVDDERKRVWEFDGEKGYATTSNAFAFSPPQTFAIWVKPGQLVNDWNMIATGGAWNRAWQLFLYYKEAPYSVDFRPWGRRLFVDNIVPRDQWTHLAVTDDGKTITLYVNGAAVKAEPLGGTTGRRSPGPWSWGPGYTTACPETPLPAVWATVDTGPRPCRRRK